MTRQRFSFKNLEVYRTTMEFYTWAREVGRRVARSEPITADQLDRAALLDVLTLMSVIGPEERARRESDLARIGRMLARLIQRYDCRPRGRARIGAHAARPASTGNPKDPARKPPHPDPHPQE